jgi:hypothetical protein
MYRGCWTLNLIVLEKRITMACNHKLKNVKNKMFLAINNKLFEYNSKTKKKNKLFLTKIVCLKNLKLKSWEKSRYADDAFAMEWKILCKVKLKLTYFYAKVKSRKPK